MTYTADLVEKEFLSKKVQDLIRQKADVKSQKEVFILELETHKKELEKEKETIYDSASFFGVFLKENAMIPYNDSFSEYLDMLIREEEAKEDLIRDDKKIKQLKNDKQAYEERKNVITKNITDAITSGSKDKKEVIPIEKVEQMRQTLCSLKYNGKTLSEALGVATSARKKILKVERANVVIAKRGMFTKFSDAFSKMNPFNRGKST
ncbi:uncharacterized protein [Pocillopora verrucosa]|uniref:uncharacterized protein n=1 Tax=Pocillopora verrucosa TaxID=203993 RepID=UPI00333FADE0